ncbi:MAG: biopolymer transporter ExbD [Chitinophagales bacterium]|nr:biopolymer transporter ExbD [Chitinophagales bacterium]MDW8393650.1 biopolymer transporter ExbD [Chitinophagales bacterium]
MTKVKMPRANVAIDMTPLVDMAFLLVTFFILTTQFRPDEPVQVQMPSSTSIAQPQEKGNLTITIAPDGRIFFDLDNQIFRRELIQRMGETYGINFTLDEINAFIVGSSIGMPMNQIKSFLALSPEDRKKVEQPGIPADSTKNLSNELYYWLENGRRAGNNPVILIKGDLNAGYPAVRNVFETLSLSKVNKFGLITADEAAPPPDALK